MTKYLTITRWIYNQKTIETKHGIAPADETAGTVDIEVVELERETDKAVKVLTLDYEMNVVTIWIPKTQIKGSNFGLEGKEAPKKEYKEVARFDSAVAASKKMTELKTEGKNSFIKYIKNDCIVMVAV